MILTIHLKLVYITGKIKIYGFLGNMCCLMLDIFLQHGTKVACFEIRCSCGLGLYKLLRKSLKSKTSSNPILKDY